MVDTEIRADRIAAMRVHDLNVVLAEARKTVIEKEDSPGENDLYMRTLELTQINADDKAIANICEAHKKDSATADESNH